MLLFSVSLTLDVLQFIRSETLWKDLGKVGLAVKASWPIVGEEDKMLTRQAKFLRDSLKNFRISSGKAKKGWTTATILVAEDYPQWKVDCLLWMQTKFNKVTGTFPDTFMNDLKDWSASTVSDKKMIKLVMQFVSFTKKEIEDVGETGMDIKCPFDQYAIFYECISYIKSQLNLEEIGVGRVDDPELRVTDNMAQNVAPGKPALWMR